MGFFLDGFDLMGWFDGRQEENQRFSVSFCETELAGGHARHKNHPKPTFSNVPYEGLVAGGCSFLQLEFRVMGKIPWRGKTVAVFYHFIYAKWLKGRKILSFLAGLGRKQKRELLPPTDTVGQMALGEYRMCVINSTGRTITHRTRTALRSIIPNPRGGKTQPERPKTGPGPRPMGRAHVGRGRSSSSHSAQSFQ